MKQLVNQGELNYQIKANNKRKRGNNKKNQEKQETKVLTKICNILTKVSSLEQMCL